MSTNNLWLGPLPKTEIINKRVGKAVWIVRNIWNRANNCSLATIVDTKRKNLNQAGPIQANARTATCRPCFKDKHPVRGVFYQYFPFTQSEFSGAHGSQVDLPNELS